MATDEAGAKTIAIFSDGTGNSSAKLFKTNVWRMYQALDVTTQPASGKRRQIAYYDDGVGTSSFRPLTVLGGVFGIGLRRNVLDLYTFLCRNYRNGDQIYAFGFSRGAFTIRLLVGLVARQGLLLGYSDEELARLAPDAYRALRQRFATRTPIAPVLRRIRDALIRLKRRLLGQTAYGEARRTEVADIPFVGVWDTVAAYGLPIAELTRGVDLWIWPLSFPDYKLSPKVTRACHALALDDERDTFHPLIWDEAEERSERLQQVWFAGVHSDVGGGYPDDALSYVSLDWMMEEAAAAELRFRQEAVSEVKRTLSETAPIHDSRRGAAAYYRYQPRKISARIKAADPTTLLMQDPSGKSRAVLTSVKIHESVIDRIRSGTDDYAPIVLPADYVVVRSKGSKTSAPKLEADPRKRAAAQEWVWNYVWKRRINYFLTVGISLALALMPAIQSLWEPSKCDGIHCGLSDIILTAGKVVPDWLQPWIGAFARSPGWFALGVLAIFLLLRRAGALQLSMQDRMRALWNESFGLPSPAGMGVGLLEREARSRKERWIRRLRTSRAYQRAFQVFKWTILPNAFGIIALILLLIIPHRVALRLVEGSNTLCELAAATSSQAFDTNSLCWSGGKEVKEGQTYRVSLTVTQGWTDGSVNTDPAGFRAGRMPWGLGYIGIPMRRSLTDRWFQPLVKVVGPDGGYDILPLQMQGTGPVYTAEFGATRTGRVFLFVNDVLLIPWPVGWVTAMYSNNKGLAEAKIEP